MGCSGCSKTCSSSAAAKNPTTFSVDVSGVVDGVRNELGHDRQRSRVELDALAADLRLARAVDDVEDLLGAVRVASQVLARLDLEVDDGRALRSGVCVQGERRPHAHRCVRVTPGFSQLQLSDVHDDPSFRFTICKTVIHHATLCQVKATRPYTMKRRAEQLERDAAADRRRDRRAARGGRPCPDHGDRDRAARRREPADCLQPVPRRPLALRGL